jgi:hypothetical protein
MVGIGKLSMAGRWSPILFRDADTVAGSRFPFQQHGRPMAELTKYKQSIVRNYYDNLDTALVQRLGEQVTDLYLAEGKKRAKLWESIAKSLTKLGVAKSRVDRLVEADDARQLAKLLQELWAKD